MAIPLSNRLEGSFLAPQSSSRPSPPPVGSRPASMLELALDSAEYVLQRRFQVVQLVYDAYQRLSRHDTVAQSLREDLALSMRLLLSWARRSYEQISWRPLLLIGVAVLYFVMPLDFGALGYADEATVITAAVQSVRDELDAFRQWEIEQGLAS